MLGRYATTRSPRPTPSRCRPARARADLIAQLSPRQLDRGRGSASSPTPPPRRRPDQGRRATRPRARRSSGSRPGTIPPPASPAAPAPPRTARGTGRRSAPRSPTRTRPDPSPTSGATPDSRPDAARVRAPARSGTGRSGSSPARRTGGCHIGAAGASALLTTAAPSPRDPPGTPASASWPRRCRPPRPPSAPRAGSPRAGWPPRSAAAPAARRSW